MLRDQLPLSEAKLEACLEDMTVPEWIRLLNGRVFFRLTRDRLQDLLGAKAYPDLRLGTAVRRVARMRRLLFALVVAGGGRRAYRLLASGGATIDVGIGRRMQRLGPLNWRIAASREVVFDVIAGPYLGPTPGALRDKLEVWERGSDMVLAAHFTPVKCGVTTTLETVRFSRPERIDFRVVRGPVPHVIESFVLNEGDEGTSLTWDGELGTDFWALGAWWGRRVAHSWEQAVRSSLDAVVAEAERRDRGRDSAWEEEGPSSAIS